MTSHCLYRFYDRTGGLLYIGITMNPTARWKQHSQEKNWWTDVANITIEPHQDKGSVILAERLAIINERPKYNIIHNRATQPIADDTISQCPTCDKESIYSRAWDRYFHVDGTNNQTCWIAISRGPTNKFDLPVGEWAADDMPDCCHDYCQSLREIYAPYHWENGVATYECQEGHRWTCHWGHNGAGTAPKKRGVPILVLEDDHEDAT
jgi:predicted GIY-YIG superfamily endonuclease